jgi:hypothetical protein
MRAILAMGLSVAVLFAIPPTQAAEATVVWETYHYADLGFSADFPTEPRRMDASIKTATPPISRVNVYARSGDVTYVVTAIDTSSDAPPADTLKQEGGILISALRGRTIPEDPATISTPAGPALEATSTDDTTVLRCRVLAVRGHAYMIAVIAPVDHPEFVRDPVAARFIDSVRVIPAG